MKEAISISDRETQTPEKLIPRLLVLTPHLSYPGGVTNYFETVKLDNLPNCSYFFVNFPANSKKILKVLALALKYIEFFFKVGKYDMVHLNVSLNFNSYYRDLGYILISRLFSKKTLVFFHGWEESFEQKIMGNRFDRFLFGASYDKVDTFVLLSTRFEKKLKNMLARPEEKNYFLITTFGDDTYLNEFNISEKLQKENDFNILFLSRILATKGIYIALDAYARVKEKLKHMKINFIVAGTGEELENVKQYVKEKNIADVQFPGYIKGYDKHKLLTNSDIMLFPTCYPEGLPSVILEGMMYGMPIISRINAGVPDVVTNGKQGYISESTDASVFAGYLEQILADNAARKQMGLNNHEEARKKYTSSSIRRRLLNIYNEVCV